MVYVVVILSKIGEIRDIELRNKLIHSIFSPFSLVIFLGLVKSALFRLLSTIKVRGQRQLLPCCHLKKAAIQNEAF